MSNNIYLSEVNKIDRYEITFSDMKEIIHKRAIIIIIIEIL